jgi:pilus assembly protein TadC
VASGAALAVGLALRGLGGGGGGPELVNWAVPAILALAGVVGLGRLEPSAARQRRTRLIFDLPQALELLSACLAAGMPLRQATRAIAASFDGPVSEDLGRLLVLVDLGISDADAWRSLRSHPQWGSAAADLARSVESGTMMVEVLMHHARASRDLRRAALEVKAKAVGVRSVLPLMTCFLPAFLLVGVIPTVASAVLNALW